MPNTQRTTPKPITQNLRGPNERFALVKAWMIDRKANNYISVFAACGFLPTAEETQTIRDWWNNRVRVTVADEALLSRMERVVEHLKAAA